MEQQPEPRVRIAVVIAPRLMGESVAAAVAAPGREVVEGSAPVAGAALPFDVAIMSGHSLTVRAAAVVALPAPATCSGTGQLTTQDGEQRLTISELGDVLSLVDWLCGDAAA